jgi:wyosine [tRNA(Phe)-imidazoG37] synthetase (radical SAM superfamily)
MSLGVDLVPRKVCSLDCVYCEVGKTTKLTLERKEYVLYDKVTTELLDYFKNNPDPDYITFSGSGEPTLNSRFGDILNFIKDLKPHIPVAVLTNGTLLYDPEVRRELSKADVVLPSLDAATERVFEKINRPADGLDIKKYIQGIVDFRKEFKGKIWLEIFFLPGYNLDDNELEELRKIIEKIGPDSVQLNTLDRPGTVENLKPAAKEELEKVVKKWGMNNVEIIASAVKRETEKAYRKDVEAVILETIARRPCTVDDIIRITGLHINEINKYLDVLEAENKIETRNQERGVFYQLKEEKP